MVANGDADKPIWIGEMNSNAVPNDPGIANVGAYGQVTLEEQARYAPLAYQRIQEEWPWIGVANFWFFKRPTDQERNQPMYYFRMVEPDFTPMPVYGAMREYASSLSPTLYPGTHQESHWALSYEGVWALSGGGTEAARYRRADQEGAALRFAFEGASLTLVPGPARGEVDVEVDGEAVRRISLDGEPVRLVRGWRGGRHEIALRRVSGELSVDALTVRPSWRPSRAIVFGAVGLLLAVVWLSACVVPRR
jgi:hypothetical protein